MRREHNGSPEVRGPRLLKYLSNKGFTLIEVLVVLVIISIVSAGALLSIRFNQNKTLENFTNNLLEYITLVQEEAMLKPDVLGIRLKNNSIECLTYLPKDKGEWVNCNEQTLDALNIPPGVSLRLEIPSPVSLGLPAIVFAINGDVSPFTFYIGKNAEDPRYAIKGEANGYIHAISLP